MMEVLESEYKREGKGPLFGIPFLLPFISTIHLIPLSFTPSILANLTSVPSRLPVLASESDTSTICSSL